jgi:hypothetical protein
MDDETTTPDAPVEGGEQPQPTTEAPAEAVETTTSTEEQPETVVAEPSEDEQLKTWADSKGLELDSDNAKKAAKMAQNAEKAMHQKAQKASELEKTVTAASEADVEATAEATGRDPELLKVVKQLQVQSQVRDFWNTEGVDKSFEPAMIELVNEKPYLAGDLETLYAAAVMKTGGVAAVKSQGKREALESLAHKQQAAVPTGNATTQTLAKKKDFSDLSISEMENQLGFVRR